MNSGHKETIMGSKQIWLNLLIPFSYRCCPHSSAVSFNLHTARLCASPVLPTGCANFTWASRTGRDQSQLPVRADTVQDSLRLALANLFLPAILQYTVTLQLPTANAKCLGYRQYFLHKQVQVRNVCAQDTWMTSSPRSALITLPHRYYPIYKNGKGHSISLAIIQPSQINRRQLAQ